MFERRSTLKRSYQNKKEQTEQPPLCTKNHMDVTNTTWLGHKSIRIRKSTSESIREMKEDD
jgi:hypothetical protein